MKTFKILLLQAYIWLFALPLFAQSESEPNNFFNEANAIAFGDTILGTIDPQGDADFYSFEVPRAGVIEISFSNLPSNSRFEGTLYDGSEAEVTSVTTFSLGTPLNFVQLVCQPGNYFIRLRSILNVSPTSDTYRFTASFDTTDVFECNNTFSTATPIRFDQELEATYRSFGDEDFYLLDVARAGVIELSFSSLPSNNRFEVSLYDESQTEITSRTSNELGAPLGLVQLVCQPGEYYFKLRSILSVSSSPNPYSLIATFDTTDIFECNNTFSTATPIGFDQELEATYRSFGDEDFYLLNVARAGVIELSFSSLPSNNRFEVSLYDESQTEITSRTSNELGAPLGLVQLVCQPGEYYFKLRSILSVSSSPNPYSLIATFDTTDVFECNNTFSTATPIGFDQELEATYRSFGDEDFYLLNVARAGVIELSFSSLPSNNRFEVSLYDESQTEITSRTSNELGASLGLVQLVCQPGEYYFKLRSILSVSSSPNPYSLIATFDTTDVFECNNSFSTATPIGFDQELEATYRSFGDEDFYLLNVARAGVIELSFSSLPSNNRFEVSLYDESQTEITSRTSNELGAPLGLVQLVCQPGEYYFKLRSILSVSSSPNPYSLIATFDTTDIYECNNSFNTASPIATCDSLIATIRSSRDEDYYQFEGMAGDSLQIEINRVPDNARLRVQVFNPQQQGLSSFQTNTGQGAISTLILPSDGTYFLSVEATSSSFSSSQIYSMFLDNNCLSTSDLSLLNEEWDLQVFPNPAKKEIFAQFTLERTEKISWKIRDGIGKLVQETQGQSFSQGNHHISIPIETLSEGIYFLHLQSEDGYAFVKFLKTSSE